jgi:hypothetical protein
VSDEIRSIERALTPQKFERWLKAQRRTAHVGEAGDECRCPLANYIQDTTGIPVRVSTNDCGGVTRRSNTKFLLPHWADEFVHRLDVVYSNAAADEDDLPGHKRLRNPDDHVEAREALTVLYDVWWPRRRRTAKGPKKKGGGR